MALLHLTGAHLAYGHVPLLSDATFSLDEGERIALIGRNGSGKSSLLRLLAGTEAPDAGLLNVQQGLRRAVVAQEPHFDDALTVFDAVAQGVQEARALRERVEQHVSGDDIDTIHARLDALDGWTWEQRVEEAIERLRLPRDVAVATLSGGTAKRVALARALVERPDVLLLDEPTNHLDIDAIEWLQSLLAAWRGALVVVSHDRAFIDAVATRIVELDRGTLRSYPGRFAAYEATKQRELEAEALAQARADKLLAAEEVWVRQGVEARRTRSVGRVARLEALRAQRAARRDSLANVRLELSAGRASGRLVAELDDVSVSLGGRLLIDHFSGTFLRGDKVGLIGPNGVGKTTMLQLMLGELAPDRGRVRRGTNLSVAYFDQMRSALKLDATLADTISPGSEWVEIGRSRRHVMSYLGDFLFAPARAQALVSTLSGGERNRLLLARLFALPANVLVLDEPTNDLDIETLELLEELLQAYDGTVFLVSHDRRFLDAVVTSTLAWEGDAGTPGLWREYPGGYVDWRVQRDRSRAAAATLSTTAPGSAASAPSGSAARNAAAPAKPRTKLSFKEQRELDGLPGQIAALEAEQKTIGERLASTELYTDEPQRVGELQARYEQIDDALTEALMRWEALDARAQDARAKS